MNDDERFAKNASFFREDGQITTIEMNDCLNQRIGSERKLALIDSVATSLWGKDLRNAHEISRAIVLPILEYLDEVLNESKKTD